MLGPTAPLPGRILAAFSHMAVSTNWGVHFIGVLVVRAPLFRGSPAFLRIAILEMTRQELSAMFSLSGRRIQISRADTSLAFLGRYLESLGTQ